MAAGHHLLSVLSRRMGSLPGPMTSSGMFRPASVAAMARK